MAMGFRPPLLGKAPVATFFIPPFLGFRGSTLIIKKDERTRHIPVVVLTSSKEDPDIKLCYQLGVNSYVVKPVEFEDFYQAVSDLGLYWMIVNQTSH